MATCIVDVGIDIVGVLNVQQRKYTAYRGQDVLRAIQVIQDAAAVATYNGKHYILRKLGALAGLEDELPLKGTHTDMRSICWSDEIWGSNLASAYKYHFHDGPRIPDFEDG